MAVMAQTLMNGAVIYSNWIERGGDNAIMYLELVDKGGSGTLAVEFYTKNYDDTGDGGTSIGSISATGSADLHSVTLTGNLKELVRYKITVGGSGSDWIACRYIGAVWYNTAQG